MRSNIRNFWWLYTAGTLIVVFMFFGTHLANADPTQQAGVGSGAIATDGSGNIIIGTSTASVANTRTTVSASSTATNFYGLRVVQPNGASVFSTRGDGYVGVGTDSPASQFTVSGNAQATTFVGGVSASNVSSQVFGAGNFAFPASLGVGYSSQVGLPATLSVLNAPGTTSVADAARFQGNSEASYFGAGAKIYIGNYNSIYSIRENPSSAYSSLRFSTTAGTTPADNMVILGNGNVGIGKTAPGAKLDILGDNNQLFLSTNGTYSSIYFQSGATNTGALYVGSGIMQLDARNGNNLVFAVNNAVKMTILNSNGNVGIGDTNPSYPLSVIGGSLYAGTFYATLHTFQDKTNYKGIALGYDTASQTGVIAADTAGAASNIAFWTYNSGWGERVRIQGNGNVGIGLTTGINSKLTVAGVIESTTGGIKFPDATVQTTAFLGGSSQTITAANVSAGSFGSNTGGGNYTFPGDILATGNYGLGLVGLYSATRYQNVFAMGSAYRLAADGTTPGNLYGIAWTHSNMGGESKAGLQHQALFMTNGVTQTAVGTGIWTIGSITAAGSLTANGVYTGSGSLFQNSGSYIYPGRSDAGNNQASWYLYSNATWGLQTNTSINAAGLYDSSNRVYSAANPQVNISGTAGSATYAAYHQSLDGDRSSSSKLPITSPQEVRYDFIYGSEGGVSSRYAGLMTYAPWTGTTGSTGDASYQLVFGGTAADSAGIPMLNIRKGIDSTWNSWYTILHSGNVGTYALPIGGGTVTGALTVNGQIYSTTGGIKFPDATVQTTAFLGGSSQTITAANVSSGSFGSNTGSGNYTFPSSLYIANGVLAVSRSSGVQISLNSAGTYYGYVGNPSSQVWGLGWSDGTNITGTALAWNTSGNVGIGTTAPTNKLVVVSADNSTGAIITALPANLSQGTRLTYRGLETLTSTMYIDAFTNQNIVMQTQSTGNVGIGVASPAYKLDTGSATGRIGSVLILNNGNTDPGNIGPNIETNGSALYLEAVNSDAIAIGFRHTANVLIGGGGMNPTLTVAGAEVLAGGSSSNWGSLNIGGSNSINAGGSIYSYTSVCVGNASGHCDATGGTVMMATGIKFPDATVQTTAFLGGSSQTITAANVSSGSFGGNTGSGNYTFPSNLTVNGALLGTQQGSMLAMGGGGNSWYGMGQSTAAGGAAITGGWYPYAINMHTGLAFSAHSAYGGIRFYNQNYPTAPLGYLAMSIVNGDVSVANNLTVGAALTTTGQINANGNIQLPTSGSLYLNGGTTYKISGGNAYIDTLNTGSLNDPIEVGYAMVGDLQLFGADLTGVNNHYIYPARTDATTVQKSWYLASNSTYGLQTNTGLNAVGGLYDNGNWAYSARNPQVNISGSAGSATRSTYLNVGSYSDMNATMPAGIYQYYMPTNRPWDAHWHWINMPYDESGSWDAQIGVSFYSNDMVFRRQSAGAWQPWQTVLNSGNYTSYSPTLTGGGASGSNWGISITGSAGSINGYTINQNLNTSDSPTFVDAYLTTGWYRNNASLTGLYNTTNGNHVYSESPNYWTMTSAGNTTGGLIFRDQHQSTLRGYVYHDTSGFGLLHSNGGWAVRVNPTTTELFNTVTANGGTVCANNNNCGYLASGGTAVLATLSNGVNQYPNRTDQAWYQINWNNAASGSDKNLYSSARIVLNSYGVNWTYGAIGWNAGAWYIEGNSTYGLYSNTGLYAAGGLWDAGNRVYSASNPQVNISGSAGSVAWANVTSHPTALSGFTNDLGNYGGWITAANTAFSAATVTFGGGTGKINVGTVDPIYTIGGVKYATYLPGMTGQKEETSGVAQLAEATAKSNEYKYTIDFNNLKKGGDLWLFSKATNLKDNLSSVIVLLTPSFDGKVWYEKSGSTLIIYSDAPGEVSYRLTAPRFDSASWTNLAQAGDGEGFNLDKLLPR